MSGGANEDGGSGSQPTPTGPGTTGRLPRTGSDIDTLLGIGLAALASGAALLHARRSGDGQKLLLAKC